jgi:hypothetical protein
VVPTGDGIPLLDHLSTHTRPPATHDHPVQQRRFASLSSQFGWWRERDRGAGRNRLVVAELRWQLSSRPKRDHLAVADDEPSRSQFGHVVQLARGVAQAVARA